ncbi:MAG: hypothetical protein RL511_1348 [Bacteroidota bacterium]|jgi:hypothetical protein
MKKGFILTILFCLTSFIWAQKNTRKGLAALQAHNYGIAASYFQKDLTKAPIAASYGWAMYYQTPLFYQADSAFSYLSQLENQLKTCDSTARQKLQTDLCFSDTTIAVLFTRLAMREFQATLNSTNLEDFEKFMQRYGQRFPSLQLEALQKRDSIAFELAIAKQQSAALEDFLMRFPTAAQCAEAKELYEKLLYQERTQDNTEEALASFIVLFPRSPYVAEAWSRIYAKYAQQQTISSLYGFVQKYPHAPQADLAWKQVYKLYMQPYSVEKLAQFRLDFPTYPFLSDLAQDGALLMKKLYPFLREGYYGFMDEIGKISIPAQYEAASAFYDGLAIVAKHNFYGLINKKNEPIVSIKYLDITFNENGFILEDSVGFFLSDMQGKFLQKEPMQWEELQQTLAALNWQEATSSEDKKSLYELVERNGKKGLNKNGKVLLQPKFDEIITSSESVLIITKQGKGVFYFDSTGKRLEINGLEWFLNAPELAKFSNEGIAVFSKSTKLGLMDTKGKVLVKNVYDAAQVVFGGLWPVQQKGKWGLISLDGKVVLPFEQQKILPFPPFGFLVEKESGLGLIDTTGKWLLQPEYKTIKHLESAYFLVENQNGLGLCSSNGAVLLPCGYQRIVRFDPDTFQLTSADGLLYFLIPELKIIRLQP